MDAERLVAMANDIANFFDAEPDKKAAVEGVRFHISRFWEKRMRQQLHEYIAQGGSGLHQLALEAAQRLG